MKLIEFDYTKPSGEVSKRSIIELMKPTKHISGYDISEMDADTMLQAGARLNEIQLRHAEEMAAFAKEFDIKNNYRMFDPERMANITSEYI